MFKPTLAAVVLFVAGALAQFTINTPSNVVECEPTLITWTGGTAPYFLSILPGATPNGTPLENLGQQNSTSVTWTCNIQAGTSIGLTLRDSTGAVVQSAPFTIIAGCEYPFLFSYRNTSLVAGPTAATTAGSGSSPTTTSPGSSTKGSSASGTSATATSTTTTGAALANAANLGVAGVIGAAAVALLL
ncbi:hypothetical protein EDC04DRAFT_2604618 [Pisolithus marmoratus]|nr:hypothetical protein EDC04DRAFT_2604618 [Pisolithus marmoratus]